MSFSIEYNKVLYKLEHQGEIYYLWLVRQGDSNVYDVSNLRAKHWNVECFGTLGEIWKRIGKRAGSVEGGGLQRAVGWSETKRYTIEEYVKQYRSKIKNARPFSRVLEDFTLTYGISFHPNMEDKELQQKFFDFINKYNRIKCSIGYRSDHDAYLPLQITKEEELKDILFNLPYFSWNDQYKIRFDVKPRKRRI